MYLDHFGLRQKPFTLATDTNFLYLGNQHKDALTLLTYGLSDNSGVILMTGHAGTGKTTLINYVMDKVNNMRKSQVVLVTNPMLIGDDLTAFLIQELGVDIEGAETAPQKFKALETYLFRMRRMRKRVLLAIDEAQCLSDELLEEIRLLSNMQRDQEILLQVLLVGQNDLKARLQSPKLSSLMHRLSVACPLGSLSLKETAEYVHHRLQSAGHKKPATVFTKEALKLLYRASAGIPRTINQLCDTAMTYGYAEEAKAIDQNIVLEVVKDRKKLGLPIGAMKDVAVASSEGEYDERLASIEGAVKSLQTIVGERFKDAP